MRFNDQMDAPHAKYEVVSRHFSFFFSFSDGGEFGMRKNLVRARDSDLDTGTKNLNDSNGKVLKINNNTSNY